MSKSITIGLILVLLSSVSGFGSYDPKEVHSDLKNGIYLVHAEFRNPDLGSQLPEGYRLMRFVSDELVSRETGKTDPDRFLVVKDKPSVPIIMDGKPNLSKTSDKYKYRLQFNMAPECVDLLEEFTGNNINERIVIIIGGRVVTFHKIRAKIRMGKIAITRCTDNGCQIIYRDLMKTKK